MRVIDTFRTVLSLAYSPCGRFLFSAGWQHVSRWDVFTGEELLVHSDRAATYLRNLVISLDSETVTWEDLARQQVRGVWLPPNYHRGLWIRPAPVPIGEYTQPAWVLLASDTYIPHTGPIATNRERTVVAYREGSRLYAAPLPPNGQEGAPLVSSRGDGVVNGRGELVSELAPDRFGFASTDLLWWTRYNSLALRDMPTGEVRFLDQLDRPPRTVTPDGRTGIATSARQVILIDLSSGLTKQRFDWDVGTVSAVVVASDGLTAAVAGWSGGIALFDLDD